uniref:PDZ domain-containing protein n=1 Tax=Hyaloperonospora arabidopsidis (strain Emoy2) TaxID=559515 RepID=M4BPQ1_HYAAE
MSQAHDLSTSKGLILQRLSQIAAARQAGYMFGYPPGVFVRENVPPAGAVPSATDGTTESHQVCSVQRVVSTAPMTRVPDVSVPTAQYTRPMDQVRVAVPVNRLDSNHEHSQRQHAGVVVGEQVQQIQAVPVPSESSDERILFSSTAGTSSISKETPVPEVGPEQTVSALHSGQTGHEASKSRQTFDLEITSDRTSGENMSCESLSSTSTLEWSISSVGTNVLVMQDAEASVTLDEKSSQTAEQAMDISTDSSLPPSKKAPEEDIMKAATSSVPASALGGETQSTLMEASASKSMSFLSPSAFSGESSILPRRQLSAASMVDYFAQVESSVGLVSVRVSRRRLNLTLGVQGTLIAVTSFVKDEAGRPGEVEASGKVFIGDVLVRVNGTFIISGLTPGHVANIVNHSLRPMTLWFKRASWDILDGKA